MGCKMCFRRALPRLARRAVLCSCKPGRLWYTRFSLSPSSRGLGRRPFKAKIAGSNPAGGTIEAASPVPSRCRAFCCPAPGVEPGGRETERTRERSPASVRGRKAPGAADPRSGDANPAGGTIEATSPVPSRCRAFCCPAPGTARRFISQGCLFCRNRSALMRSEAA